MNKKLAQGAWLIIVTLFISMLVYHVLTENYGDLIIALMTVIIILVIFAAYYLLKQGKNGCCR